MIIKRNQKLYWVILHIYAHTHTTSFAKSRWVNESDLDKCSLAIFFTTCTSWPPLHWNTFPKGIAFEYTWYNDGQNDQTSTQNIDHQRLMMALNGFCILISNSCEYFFIVFVSGCCAINENIYSSLNGFLDSVSLLYLNLIKTFIDISTYLYVFQLITKHICGKAVLRGMKTGNEALKIIMMKQNVQRIKTCMQYYDGLRYFLDN